MSNPYRIKWIVWQSPAGKFYIKRLVHEKQLADMQASPSVLQYIVIEDADKQAAFSEGYVKLSTSKRKI